MPFQVLQLNTYDQSGAHRAQSYHRVASLARIWDGDTEWSAPTLDVLHPDLSQSVLACDVLVIHTLTRPEIETVIRLRRARGKPTVCEIADNYLVLSGYLRQNSIAHSPLLRQRMLYYAWLCDGLQVSSAGLAQLLERVNPNLAVMDNHVPIPPHLPAKPPGFVFGWGGTRQHQQDLEPIAPVIAAFCRRHPDAIFAYKGHRDVYESCFRDLPGAQARFEPFGPYSEFQSFLKTLHVGLAPLIDTPVNRCRTDVKFAEYAAQGVAAVLADAPIYRRHAAHARLFAGPVELETLLEELYNDRAKVAELAQRAYAWLTIQRTPSALGAQRRQFYQSLLGPTAAPSDAAVPPDCTALCAQLAQAWKEHSEKRYDVALEGCQSLLGARSDYAQAQYLYALSLAALRRGGEALAFLDRQEVSPVFQDIFAEFQVRLARNVCPTEVDRYLSRIQAPLQRLRLQGDRAMADGAMDKLAFHREVLRLQPFDYFALMTVIRLLTKHSPADPELIELKERACLVAADLVPREWLPATLQPLLRNN